jgi:hypothetical protein
MMEQGMCTAPFMGGGVAAGSGGVLDGLLLRKNNPPALEHAFVTDRWEASLCMCRCIALA